MAGEADGPRRWWQVPKFIQESLALVFGTLLVASIIGLYNIGNNLSVLTVQLAETQKDLAAITAWKEEFGAKPRWGEDDAREQGILFRRDLDRLESRISKLATAYFEHDRKSTKYIERIDNDRKMLEHQNLMLNKIDQRLDRIEAQVTGHLTMQKHHK